VSGQKNGRTLITTDDWMRDVEKRSMHEGRRPQIRTASDLMGPGLGPQAVEIRDWNDEVTTFNGFFFSTPGAQNSPDGNRYWMGYVIADESGNGIMRVYEYTPDSPIPSAPPLMLYRNFKTTPGSLRTFGPWYAGANYNGSVYITKTTDANATAGNRPALLIGNVASGEHLRIDANEIIAMDGDAVQGRLTLNGMPLDTIAPVGLLPRAALTPYQHAVTHQSPFAPYGGGYISTVVHEVGGMVIVNLLFALSASQTVDTSWYTMCTLPADCPRPYADVFGPAVISGSDQQARSRLRIDKTLQISTVTGSRNLTTSSYIAVNFTYCGYYGLTY
jgi:hypothetical protein